MALSTGVAGDFTVVRSAFNLQTQQKRLRHLRSIAVRNLHCGSSTKDLHHQLQCFFTLHSSRTSAAFYTSEIIRGSMNPSWQNFDLSRCEEEVNLASKFGYHAELAEANDQVLREQTHDFRYDIKCEHAAINAYSKNYKLLMEKPEKSLRIGFDPALVLRVWAGNRDKFCLLIMMDVHLTGLHFLAEKLQNSLMKHPPNTVIFGMLDKFFIYINKEQADVKTLARNVPDVDLPSTLLPAVVKVDQSLQRNSYNTSSVCRIQTVLRAIKQLQAHGKRHRNHIEDRLLASQENTQRLVEQENCRTRVGQLREELFRRTAQLHATQDKYAGIKDSTVLKEQILKCRMDETARKWNVLNEDKKEYIDKRERLVKENALLHLRRKQMLSELVSYIYPLTEVNGKYFISGVRLPHAEEMQGQDEVMLSVGLGNTCHLTLKMSQILDLPLRHPMENRGSRSVVSDQVNPKLEKEREFPLYCKGKDKVHFKYAVYLLNKNISQMRYFFGLPTQDLRLILPNVITLLQRIGVKMDDDKEKDKLAVLRSPQCETNITRSDDTPSSLHPSTTSSVVAIEALLPSPAMALSAVNSSADSGRKVAPGRKCEGAEGSDAGVGNLVNTEDAISSTCRSDEVDDLFRPLGDDQFFKSQSSSAKHLSSGKVCESSGVCGALGEEVSHGDERNQRLMEILESASAGETLLPKSFKLVNQNQNTRQAQDSKWNKAQEDSGRIVDVSEVRAAEDIVADAVSTDCSCDSNDSDTEGFQALPRNISGTMLTPDPGLESCSNSSSPVPDSQLMKEMHNVLLMEDGER